MAPVEPADPDKPARADDQPRDEVAARLLLALTALYVQRSNHTAEEQRQYTELVLGLIDRAGPAACATVADRLRRHPNAAAAVIDRLRDACFHDNGADSAPPDAPPYLVQNHTEDRIEDHLQGRAREADPAARNASEGDTFPALADNRPPDGNPPNAQAEPAQQSPVSTPPAPQPARLTPEFGEAFFEASPPERRRVLAEIGCTSAVEAAPEHGRRFHVRIDVAHWLGRTGAFARDFQRLINAPSSLCARILDDPSGEPMAIAARATGMPAAVLQRILLLVSPAAHPVARVYELTNLYYSLDRGIARDLLDAWRRAAGNAAMTDRKQTPAASVTNVRARLRALNARIESTADR